MKIYARVLGVAQDAGVPHTGCSCPRCERHRAAPLHPACLGLVGQRTYLVDATPALPEQIRMLPAFPSAVLLTHTHMGHVAGLLQLGEEACDAEDVVVHGPPGVAAFLRDNEPWSRLVERRNIRLAPTEPAKTVQLEEGLAVDSFPVRHRGLDTVGYFVKGPRRTLLYLPDIDRWDIDLPALLRRCDLALLDGSFYSRDELPRQTEIPHPPITDTLDMLAPEEAAKVRFTHFNHTNPVLDPDGPNVLVAVQGETIALD
ncbi:MAG: MBL fold metallo-hydrolase [Planctomycetota bacterium]|jgi:pyrroloquinoline quinone biosynthesis protein B